MRRALRKAGAALAIAGAVATLGCAASAPSRVEPLAGEPADGTVERALWDAAALWEKAIAASDAVVRDDALQSYLEGVAKRVYAHMRGPAGIAPRVLVLREPLINASASPNGLVVVHSGILARLGSEAELATLFGHELAHFVGRHALYERNLRQSAQQSERLARALSLGLFGRSAASSRDAVERQVSGFSQAREREADQVGFEAMRDAGYDARESVRLFEVVLLDEDAPKIEDPFYYADHPSMESRAQHYRELLAAAPAFGGEIGAERYARAVHAVIVQNVTDDLELSRVRSARRGVDRLLAENPTDADAQLMLGEWHRLAESGAARLGSAVRAYRESVRLAPESARGWRALGLALRELACGPEAADALERAITLAPGALDRPILEADAREQRAAKKSAVCVQAEAQR